ncbi:predicted protein [Chaetoceros tenuissimus]|uniref:Uncharacterized protein n=1 Tax=Chaetoceros tenuissimus TaxID=426638 RepID=A0AAD3D3K7_9STRA|nr:predicted protein [Chaetoceros tenuissimus]
MVSKSKLESKLDQGFFLETQFDEDGEKKWHPIIYDNEGDYYKIEDEDGPRNFKNGSQVQSVKGYKIYYYDELRWEVVPGERVDVLYFVGDEVYSKNYSFDKTEKEEDGWILSELNAIPCREEKMQLALCFEGLEDVPNGYYRFKPLKGSWEKSKASFHKEVKGENLYGYDVVYHDEDEDTLFVDRNGDIYSKKFSFDDEEAPIAYTLYGGGIPPPYYNPYFTNTSATKSRTKRRRAAPFASSTVTPSSSSSAKKRIKTSPAATPLVLSKSAKHSVQHQQGGMVTNERQVRSNGQQQSDSHIDTITEHASNDDWSSPQNPSVCRRSSDNGSPSEEEENKKKERETAKKVAKLEKDIKKKDNRKLELIELKKIVQVEQFKLKGDIDQEQEGLKLVGDLLLFLKNEKAYNENEWGETKLKGAFKHIRTHFDPGCENDKKTLEAINELEEEYPDDLYKKVPFRGVFENDDDFKEYEASLKRAEAKIIPILYSALAKYKDTKKVEKDIKITMESLKRERDLRQRRLEKLSGRGSTNN